MAGLLAFVPFLGLIFPRVLAFVPGVIALIGFIGFRQIHKRWPPLHKAAFIWAVVISALTIVGSIWAIDPAEAFDHSFNNLLVMVGGALLFSLAKILDQKTLKDFQKFFLWSVLTTGVFCVFDLYTNAPIYLFFHPSTIIDSVDNLSFFNRSTIVFFLFGFTALCMVRFSAPADKKQKRITIILALLIALAIFKTNSQSAQMGFVLMVLFYFLFPYRKAWAWYGLSAVLTAVIFAVPWAAQFLFKYFLPAAMHIEWLQQGSAPARMEILDFISRRALEKPLWGYGTEATRFIQDFDTAERFHPSTHVLHPHNFALQMWIEYGVLGAAMTAAFFIDILRRIKTAGLPMARLYLPLFFATASVAATGYGLWQSWWLGAFGLLFVYAILVERIVAPPQSTG